MGKATIIESLGKGLYRATVERKHDRIDARLVAITADLVKIADDVLAQQQIILLNQNEAEVLYGQMVALAQQNPPVERRVLDAKIKEYAAVASKIEVAQQQIRLLNAKKAALLSEQARLQAAPKSEEKQLWCADYSAGLSGTVGTLETTAATPIILPGHPDNGGNQYDYNVHGILLPLYETGVASSLYAFGMEPGWRKWKPFYRTGTITSLVGNIAQVTLDAEPAAANADLETSQTSTLADVPIDYMGSTDGAVFEPDDHVVIQFHNKTWASRTIIGFVDHPRPPGWCESFEGLLYDLGTNDPARWPAEWKSGGGWNAVTNSNDVRYWLWEVLGGWTWPMTIAPRYEEWWEFTDPTAIAENLANYGNRQPYYRYGMTRSFHKICYWQDATWTSNGMEINDHALLFPGDCSGLLYQGAPVSDSTIPSGYTHLVIDYSIEGGWIPDEPYAVANTGYIILHQGHRPLFYNPYYGISGFFNDSLLPEGWPWGYVIQLCTRDQYVSVLDESYFGFGQGPAYTGILQHITCPNDGSGIAYLAGESGQRSLWAFPANHSYASVDTHRELVLERAKYGLPVPYAIEFMTHARDIGSAYDPAPTWVHPKFVMHSIRFETR